MGILICTGIFVLGQARKQFHEENSDDFDKVKLFLKVNSGDCFLKPNKNEGVLDVYSQREQQHFSHTYNKQIIDRICQMNLILEDNQGQSLGSAISTSLFGPDNKSTDNLWQVFISEGKPYDLSLNYGIGTADIDLSGLSIETLKIHTGSADVNIGYFSGQYNKVVMDTFYVKVDLGSVRVTNLNHAKSKYVIADVGFGNLMLDLSDVSVMPSTIKGNVGAGTMHITLPRSSTPVKVTLTDSWLCRIHLPKNFRQLSENVYVNEYFGDNNKNLLTFNLDISMGTLIFVEK
ncbi:MAG: hypothetical protein OEX02_00430 [Cyclobacteriaceae bacterium]|nr:hypothetical protein [Cyclobacteriaceae bacterium]